MRGLCFLREGSVFVMRTTLGVKILRGCFLQGSHPDALHRAGFFLHGVLLASEGGGGGGRVFCMRGVFFALAHVKNTRSKNTPEWSFCRGVILTSDTGSGGGEATDLKITG